MGRELSSCLITGFPASWIRFKAGISLLKISFQTTRNPYQAIKALNLLIRQRKRLHGNSRDHKIVKSGNRYYWSMYTPGFPSEGFKIVVQREIQRAFHGKDKGIPLQTLILSISSRCHYSCEHCYEGDNLCAQEHLSYNDLSCALEDAMQIGLRHIQLGGGEPMLRFDDMIKLIRQANGKIEFWLSTSGYGLTQEHANKLKSAGLTGVTVSLDHWDKEQHNRFRHHSDAYDWAMKAINNCNEAGIITNLTLCVTREMANERDLMKYMELARELRVPFVRFLEARKAGNYAGKDILLRKQELATVLNFYLRLNSEKRYSSFPIIQYPGYHQRKLGCFGAGNRYLHIDSMGFYHGCPFCRGAVGNISEISLQEAIPLLQQKGCQLFHTNHHV